MTPTQPAPAVSIVSTLYRSSRHLEEFCRRATDAAERAGVTWELVLVNDGSPDDSLDRALALRAAEPRIVVVDLARNFGHHPAILAGLASARGEKVFLIDCDLEEHPEWLPDFLAQLDREDADVVYGQQQRRKGGWFEAVSGGVFYQLFNRISEVRIPPNWITARLMRRRYVDALLQFGERELFLGGTFMLAGFRQVGLPVDKGSRGTSSYSLARRLRLFINALTSFSPRPLHLVFGLGTVVTLVALAGFCVIFFRGLRGETMIGWASLMASIWLFGGLTMFCLGLIGIYVGKILIETKRRPLYLIREIHRGDGAGQAPAEQDFR
ncbi:MAG: glycosyltransferase family 2 protein [Verrucomicrobiales bacterium]|nr:glycosyltransferase family 2 protein [Verrucomicrobiales bacterium]